MMDMSRSVWCHPSPKVAPLRQQSIPRLELLGTCILERLMDTVQRSMPQEIQKFYWTNSKTALSWIMNEKPWKQYLNHRVPKIRTLTAKDEWNYRKWPCISHTFFHKIEAKNQGCGLSMDTSVFGGLKP